MQINILIGGKAGDGTITISELVSSSLVKAGFFVFNYKDYQSLIRGGHNFNLVSFSDTPINSNGNKLDLLIAFDSFTYERHKHELTTNTIIATSDKELSKNLKCTFIDTQKQGKKGNMALASFLFKVLGLPKELLLEEMYKLFTKEEIRAQNKPVIDQYYSPEYLNHSQKELTRKLAQFKVKNTTEQVYLSGSEAIAQAAVDSGLEIYFGYPMTPSTALLTSLALKQKDHDLFVFTLENEIAVINSALGASYSGRKVMVGTSSGGFDLMTEGISLQGIAEIPLVIHLAQRMGPGTGVPTYTSQGDLNVAIYGGHGEFPRVVVAPGDAEEAYEKTVEAIYLAEKLNVVSIILTDKHLAESSYTAKIKKTTLKIPSRTEFPGKGIFRKSSYEHDSLGNTVEEAEKIKIGVEKRLLKSRQLTAEARKFTQYKIYGNGPKLLVGYGSTKGAILDWMNRKQTETVNQQQFTYLHLIYLEPFPSDPKLIALFHKAKNIFVLENTSTGQLSELICRHLALKIPHQNRILKYDALPFTPEDIDEEIKQRIGRKNV